MKKLIKTLATLLIIAICIFQTVVILNLGGIKENSTLITVSELITIICLVIILYIFLLYQKENKELKRNLAKKDREIKKIIRDNKIALEEEEQRLNEIRNKHMKRSNDLRKAIAKKQILADEYKAKLEALTDKYERAQKLYPNLNDEVNAMIKEEIRQLDMKKAAEVDLLARDAVRVSTSRGVVQKIENVLAEYYRLSERQKSYVKSDISKLEKLYKNSLEKQKQEEKK